MLVCTTGPSHPPQLLERVPIEAIQQRLNELLFPLLHMMHAVLPVITTQRSGVIVNVASDAAKVATPRRNADRRGDGGDPYVLQGGGARRRSGIRINVLTPSLIAGTPGAALISANSFSAKMFQKAAAMAHLGVAEADDLAAMAVFLASPAARRVTGQAISVNRASCSVILGVRERLRLDRRHEQNGKISQAARAKWRRMTDLTLGGAAWQSVGDDTDGQAAWAVAISAAHQPLPSA